LGACIAGARRRSGMKHDLGELRDFIGHPASSAERLLPRSRRIGAQVTLLSEAFRARSGAA
jgi:hypothetical protein